ncbi:MAG: peptide ABC transporter substrate-binding protein [Lachnospiraceae bacterium]|nr:peptide ABC transporter substrate-binding protein [Lachnospiraceae bacterium]
MKKNRILAGVLAIGLIMAGSGCRAQKAYEAQPPAAGSRENGTIRSEDSQVLNLQLDAEISTLDPQAAVDSASFEVIACLMEGLYTIDENGSPKPAMAERMEVSQDGRSYRFYLRDAVWSDGQPVTAEDFVYSWRRGIDPDQGNENAALFRIAGLLHAEEILSGTADAKLLGVRAADEKVLEVELSRPVPYFISMLALPEFYPMNQAFFESCQGQYGISPDTVLGNGPFCLEYYQPAGQEIRLVKNPDYWQADRVKLDEISYQVVKDSQQALMVYEQGMLDMALLSGKQVELYGDSPEFRSLPLGSLWYISPNLRTAGLENESLRMALALSYDKETAVSMVMKDGSKAAYCAVPANSMYGPDGQDFRDGAAEYLKTDKELAARYLEQAKQELGQDAFTFTLLIEDTEAAGNLGQFLQEEIQNALPGVAIQLEPVPKKMRLERMASGDYELGLTRWGADYSDPLAFLDMWTTDSAFNYGKWSDPVYDQLIASASQEPLTLDAAARWETLHQAEARVLEQAVIFPVCEKANGMLLRSTVKNAQFHTIGVNRVWSHAWKEAGEASAR